MKQPFDLWKEVQPWIAKLSHRALHDSTRVSDDEEISSSFQHPGSSASRHKYDNDSLREAANAARDAQNWGEAARLYKQALEVEPHNPGLLTQLGNCCKEAGLFDSAYKAYVESLLKDYNSDTNFQLARLLKMTGNIYASKYYFAQALNFDSNLLGSEWLTFPDPSVMTALDPMLAGIKQETSTLLQILAWCEQDFGNIERQQSAAFRLAEAGYKDASRLFFEMSFIRAGFSESEVQNQKKVALQTGLWGLGGPIEIRSLNGGGPRPPISASLNGLMKLIEDKNVSDTAESRTSQGFDKKEFAKASKLPIEKELGHRIFDLSHACIISCENRPLPSHLQPCKS